MEQPNSADLSTVLKLADNDQLRLKLKSPNAEMQTAACYELDILNSPPGFFVERQGKDATTQPMVLRLLATNDSIASITQVKASGLTGSPDNHENQVLAPIMLCEQTGKSFHLPCPSCGAALEADEVDAHQALSCGQCLTHNRNQNVYLFDDELLASDEDVDVRRWSELFRQLPSIWQDPIKTEQYFACSNCKQRKNCFAETLPVMQHIKVLTSIQTQPELLVYTPMNLVEYNNLISGKPWSFNSTSDAIRETNRMELMHDDKVLQQRISLITAAQPYAVSSLLAAKLSLMLQITLALKAYFGATQKASMNYLDARQIGINLNAELDKADQSWRAEVILNLDNSDAKQTQTTGVDTSTVSPSKVHTVSIKIVSEENGFITFSMDELAIEDGKISQGDKLVFDFSAVEGLSLSKQLSVFCIGQEKGQYLFRSAVAEPNENELQQIKMLKHLPDVNVNVSRSGTVGTAKTTGFDSAFIGELMLRILLSHQGLRVTEERQKLAKILDQIRGRATAIADLAALKQFLKPFCATGEPFNVSNLFYETSEEQALDFDEAQWLDILGLIFSIYVSQAKFSVQAHSSGAIDCCQKISQALQAQLAVLTTQASTVVVEEPQSKLADLADVKSILMSIFDDENWVSQSLAFVNGESPKRVPSAKPAVSTPTNEHLPDQSFIQNLKNNAQTAVSTSTPDLDATVILDASMREQLSSPEANRSSPAAAVNELEETVILSKEDMQNTVSRLRNAVPTQSSKPHSPALDETMIISPDMLPKEKI